MQRFSKPWATKTPYKFSRKFFYQMHPLRKLLQTAFGAIALCLSGCSEIRVETVRTGTLDFDESKTIGDVLDNTSLLSNGKWTSFDAVDGSHVVEFQGDISDLQAELASISSEFQKNPAALTLGALASGGEMGAIGLGMILNSGMEIKTCRYTIQFLMSKRDPTRFEIGASSVEAKVKMPDGSIAEEIFNDEEHSVLECLYESNKAAIGMFVLSRAMLGGIFQNLMEGLQE
jgi:hypothetical protein